MTSRLFAFAVIGLLGLSACQKDPTPANDTAANASKDSGNNGNDK